MILTGLSDLHHEMNKHGLEKQIFQYQIRDISFTALFIASLDPYELSLTTSQGNQLFLLFKISQDYSVIPKIDDKKYRQLAKLLRTDGSSGNKLIPRQFLQELDNHVSSKVRVSPEPNAQQMTSARPDLEEHDKPYFHCWRNTGAKGQQVSEKNLFKTKLILGKEAASHSRRHQLSSVWTSNPDRSKSWLLRNFQEV